MDAANVQRRVADTLLERGVRFKIPAPFFLKLIGIKHRSLVIYPLKYGTLLAMSGVGAGLEIDPQKLSEGSINEALKLVEKHGDRVAVFVATAVVNSNIQLERRARLLAERLKWRLTPSKMAELLIMVVMLCGVQDFTSTIRFLNTMNLTRRKEDGNLSHETSGS